MSNLLNSLSLQQSQQQQQTPPPPPVQPGQSELYFLIAKLLLDSPFKQCARDLIQQLELYRHLPPRLDWLGSEHPRSFDELNQFHSHIPHNHLLQICEQLKSVFEQSSGLYINTLLGSGQFSLLQDLNKLDKAKQATNNKLTTSNPDAIPKAFYLKYHAKEPGRRVAITDDVKSRAGANNLILNLVKKQNGARMAPTDVVQAELYQSLHVHKRILGHLSAVYCVCFERTGRLVLTGADDSLIKAWSVNEGRLMATFRGHEKEISDIDINFENTLLASGSCDKTIRIWNLRTTECLTVLHAHSAMVSSVEFSPYCRDSTRWLASAGFDSAVCVWEWNVNTLAFNPKPVKKCIEKSRAGAQILCLSFSPGGTFLVAGSNDSTVRVYHISNEGGGAKEGSVTKLTDLGFHSNEVDSIQFSNSSSLRFMSGSKDGTARIWWYENQTWRSIRLETSKTFTKPNLEELSTLVDRRHNVTMVAWNRDDSVALTAQSNNHVIKVWNPADGVLIHELKGHSDEVFVLEAHPHDPRLLFSAGHDGNVILWNVLTGKMIKKFYNRIENEGHGCIFDAKWSPSLSQFAATDSHGFLTLYGFGGQEDQTSRFNRTPAEQFFHTDYRPLMRDQNGFVLDEQTQQLPHLMPPPFLVDADGNPYPAEVQRFVPGRELLTDLTQLTPTMVVNNANGLAEIITTDQREASAREEMGGGENDAATAAAVAPEQQPDINTIRWVKNLVGPLDQVVLRTSEKDRLECLEREETYFAQECQKEPTGATATSRSGWIGGDTVDYDNEASNSRRRGGRGGRRNETTRGVTINHHHLNEDSNNIMVIDHNEESQQNFVVDILEDYENLNTMDTMGGGAYPTRNQQRTTRGGAYVTTTTSSDPISDENHVPASSNDNDEDDDDQSSEYSDWAADDGRRGLRPPPRRTAQQQQPQSTSRRGRRSNNNTNNNNNVGRQPKRRAYVIEEDDDDDDEEEEANRRLTTRQKSLIAAKRAAREAQRQQREQPQRRQVNYNEQDENEDEEEEEVDVQNTESSNDEQEEEDYNQSSENSENEDDDDTENDENRDPNKPCTSRSVAVAAATTSAAVANKAKKGKRGRKPKLDTSTYGKKSKVSARRGKKSKNGASAAATKASLNMVTVCPAEYRPPDWLTGTMPRKSPYVPQIGDDVVYFRQGHELYVRTVQEKNIYELDESSLPWNQIDPSTTATAVNESNMTENGEDDEDASESPSSNSNKTTIQVQEFCRVTGMKIELRPPRLVCLKLSVIDRLTGTLTGVKFSIKYHDVDNVPDFVILKQFYDLALEKNWRARDRFRCIIDDRWYLGTIAARKPYEDKYPESQFQCLSVEWEDGQPDMLSPWDLEPLAGGGANARKSRPVLAADQLPSNGEEVTAEDMRSLVYVPSEVAGVEWPEHGRDQECLRILAGFEKIMELSVAEHFSYPVDLEAFPTYAMVIPYPIDLNTIKERVANHYYRRVNSIQWDVRHIEQNAEKFNEKSSDIVKKAALLTELLMEFIIDPYCSDPMAIYKDISSRNNKLRSSAHNNTASQEDESMMQVDDDEEESEQEEEEEEEDDDDVPIGRRTRRSNTNTTHLTGGGGAGGTTNKFNLRRRTVAPNLNETQNYLNVSMSYTTAELWWRKVCKRLVSDIMKHPDSMPFRSQVDSDEYPDYAQIIKRPMDFSVIRNRLNLNLYASIREFDADCKLVFHNSKSYNTNKRSQIYGMTLRLQSLYEHKISEIMKQQEAHLARDRESRTSRRSRNAESRATTSGFTATTTLNSSSRLRSSNNQQATTSNSDLYDVETSSRLRTRSAVGQQAAFLSSSTHQQPSTSASNNSIMSGPGGGGGASKRFIIDDDDDANMATSDVVPTSSRSFQNTTDLPTTSSSMSKRFRVSRADSGTLLSYNDIYEHNNTTSTTAAAAANTSNNQSQVEVTTAVTTSSSIVNNEQAAKKSDNLQQVDENEAEDEEEEIVNKKPVTTAASRKKRIEEDDDEDTRLSGGFIIADQHKHKPAQTDESSEEEEEEEDNDEEFVMKTTPKAKKRGRGRPKLESRRENNSSNNQSANNNTKTPAPAASSSSSSGQKSTRPVRSCRANSHHFTSYDNKENDDEYQQYNGNASTSGANTTNSDDQGTTTDAVSSSAATVSGARSKRTKAVAVRQLTTTRRAAAVASTSSKSNSASRSKSNSVLNSSSTTATTRTSRSCRKKASYCELSGDEEQEFVFEYQDEYTQEHVNSEEEANVGGDTHSSSSSSSEEEESESDEETSRGVKRARTRRRRNRSSSSRRHNTSLRKRPRLTSTAAAASTTASTTTRSRVSSTRRSLTNNHISNPDTEENNEEDDDDDTDENEEIRNNATNNNDDDRSHSSSMLINTSKSTAAAC